MFKKKKEQDEFEMVKLRTAYGIYEKEVIEGLLQENNIPYIPQGNGIGGYMTVLMGTSGCFGTDILVSGKDLERALELLNLVDWDEVNSEQEIPEEEWNTGLPPEEEQ